MFDLEPHKRQSELPSLFSEVEKDKIEATFKDGVLTLRLPKAKGSKKKTSKIEIA